MGILGLIVEPLVLSMLDARHGLALGSLRIPPALDQHVKDEAILVNSPPEILALTANGQDNLVEMPFVATTGCPSAHGCIPRRPLGLEGGMSSNRTMA